MAVCKSCNKTITSGDYCKDCLQNNIVGIDESDQGFDSTDSEDDLLKLFHILSKEEANMTENLNELNFDENYDEDNFYNGNDNSDYDNFNHERYDLHEPFQNDSGFTNESIDNLPGQEIEVDLSNKIAQKNKNTNHKKGFGFKISNLFSKLKKKEKNKNTDNNGTKKVRNKSAENKVVKKAKKAKNKNIDNKLAKRIKNKNTDSKAVKKAKNMNIDNMSTKESMAIVEEVNKKDNTIVCTKKSIIFIGIFAIVTSVCIFIGSGIYTYSLALNKGNDNFQNRNYSEAYNEMNSLPFMREEDTILYNKVKTVMMVQKYLNLYDSYNALGMEQEGKQSLLDGIVKYEEIREYAEDIDVLEDIEYVKNQILDTMEKE